MTADDIIRSFAQNAFSALYFWSALTSVYDYATDLVLSFLVKSKLETIIVVFGILLLLLIFQPVTSRLFAALRMVVKVLLVVWKLVTSPFRIIIAANTFMRDWSQVFALWAIALAILLHPFLVQLAPTREEIQSSNLYRFLWHGDIELLPTPTLPSGVSYVEPFPNKCVSDLFRDRFWCFVRYFFEPLDQTTVSVIISWLENGHRIVVDIISPLAKTWTASGLQDVCETTHKQNDAFAIFKAEVCPLNPAVNTTVLQGITSTLNQTYPAILEYVINATRTMSFASRAASASEAIESGHLVLGSQPVAWEAQVSSISAANSSFSRPIFEGFFWLDLTMILSTALWISISCRVMNITVLEQVRVVRKAWRAIRVPHVRRGGDRETHSKDLCITLIGQSPNSMTENPQTVHLTNYPIDFYAVERPQSTPSGGHPLRQVYCASPTPVSGHSTPSNFDSSLTAVDTPMLDDRNYKGLEGFAGVKILAPVSPIVNPDVFEICSQSTEGNALGSFADLDDCHVLETTATSSVTCEATGSRSVSPSCSPCPTSRFRKTSISGPMLSMSSSTLRVTADLPITADSRFPCDFKRPKALSRVDPRSDKNNNLIPITLSARCPSRSVPGTRSPLCDRLNAKQVAFESKDEIVLPNRVSRSFKSTKRSPSKAAVKAKSASVVTNCGKREISGFKPDVSYQEPISIPSTNSLVSLPSVTVDKQKSTLPSSSKGKRSDWRYLDEPPPLPKSRREAWYMLRNSDSEYTGTDTDEGSASEVSSSDVSPPKRVAPSLPLDDLSYSVSRVRSPELDMNAPPLPTKRDAWYMSRHSDSEYTGSDSDNEGNVSEDSDISLPSKLASPISRYDRGLAHPPPRTRSPELDMNAPPLPTKRDAWYLTRHTDSEYTGSDSDNEGSVSEESELSPSPKPASPTAKHDKNLTYSFVRPRSPELDMNAPPLPTKRDVWYMSRNSDSEYTGSESASSSSDEYASSGD